MLLLISTISIYSVEQKRRNLVISRSCTRFQSSLYAYKGSDGWKLDLKIIPLGFKWEARWGIFTWERLGNSVVPIAFPIVVNQSEKYSNTCNPEKGYCLFRRYERRQRVRFLIDESFRLEINRV